MRSPARPAEGGDPRRWHRAGRGPARGVRRLLRPAPILGVAASLLLGGSSTSALRPDAAELGSDCRAVGAAVTTVGQSGAAGLASFEAAAEELGPLTMRRSFDRVLPEHFGVSSAAQDAEAGLRSFVSWKPPHGDHRGAARGRYDEQITAWAESVPRTGVYATAFHEPENDMTAAEFVAFQRHVYAVVKRANPTIRWGPVYMAYWWDPQEPDHFVGDPAAWWPGDDSADFAALDWYAYEPTPMTRSRSFLTWYRTMEPTGLPLIIAEYGQYHRRLDEPRDPEKERARAAAIREDAEWMAEHPEVVAWLYWQAGDATGEWRMRDAGSLAAWRAAAVAACGS